MAPAEAVIDADRVSRSFGRVQALDGVSLQVGRGRVLGLLGHNGAGKSTLINVLATLLPPTGGRATVAGYDVVRQGAEVRSRIGLTGQFAAVDEQLSGLDNLVLVARLLGATRRDARVRAAEMLAVFGLEGAARRPARTYSGGMRRRLDLAISLVGRPAVIFLDEPTTGLDPASRQDLWEVIRGLVGEGAAVLLTTQYLDEADRLADHIMVLADGRTVASGTAAELKAQVGQRAVHVSLADPADAGPALGALDRAGLAATEDRPGHLAAPVSASTHLLSVVRALDDAGVGIAELTLTEPTLDDVYLALARIAPPTVQEDSR